MIVTPGVFTMPSYERKRMLDPYQSPRVLRAVLDETIDQLGAYLANEKCTKETLYFAQMQLDMTLQTVHFRGVQVLKLISISITEHGGDLAVSFKPMSEDGEWLLEKMAVNKPISEVHFNPVAEAAPITRVLDL